MNLQSKKLVSLLFCLLFFFSHLHYAKAESVEQQTVLAVLTFNVASFTRWPEHVLNNDSSVLNLCVYGGNVVQQAFEGIDNKEINNKKIRVINLSRLRDLDQCQLLYLSELKRKRLIPLLAEMEGKPVLTIGENMGFLRAGGMVGLEKVNGTIQLSFNLPVINKSELVVSSRLLSLANIVDFPRQVD